MADAVTGTAGAAVARGAAVAGAAVTGAAVAGAAAGFRKKEAQMPPMTANTTPDQMNVDMSVPTAPGESAAPAVPPARAAMTLPASAAVAANAGIDLSRLL